MTPGPSHPDKGDAVGIMTELFNALFGTLTVANGQSSGSVQLDPSYDGQPVVAMLNTVDGIFLRCRSAVWNGSGLLTVAGEGNATADLTVSYHVKGKNV
jgi:hypothetical protein